MAFEIERKFLVIGNEWRKSSSKVFVRQGYLSAADQNVVRIRVAGTQASLTIKGKTIANRRPEFEYQIPLEDAEYMLEYLCLKPVITKFRFTINSAARTWIIDEFLAENEGLIVAEIELESQTETFRMPIWIGREVTGDPRYYNSNLIKHSYKEWNE